LYIHHEKQRLVYFIFVHILIPSFLIKNKIDDSLIAERLGDTVTELRKTYAHIYDSMRQNMKKILDETCKIE